MTYVVRVGSRTADESIVGPFTSRAAAVAFRDKIQVRIDALADNLDGVWTEIGTLERPALATLVREWGLRRPNDSITNWHSWAVGASSAGPIGRTRPHPAGPTRIRSPTRLSGRRPSSRAAATAPHSADRSAHSESAAARA